MISFIKSFCVGLYKLIIQLPVLLSWYYAFYYFQEIVGASEGWPAVFAFLVAVLLALLAIALTAAAGLLTRHSLCIGRDRRERRKHKEYVKQ